MSEITVLNSSPIVHNIATPVFSKISVLNGTPTLQNIATPVLFEGSDTDGTMEFGRNLDGIPIMNTLPTMKSPSNPEFSNGVPDSACNQQVCNDSCDELIANNGKMLNNTFLFEKYVSKEFCDKKDIDHQEVSLLLKKIRIKNINRVIIGHLNVNFFAPKLDAIKTIIPGNVDIMVFSETKLDASYPMSQLFD